MIALAAACTLPLLRTHAHARERDVVVEIASGRVRGLA
jgi:hypothetical protein